MSALELLTQLTRLGVRTDLRLRLDAPVGTMTPDLMERVRLYKPDLIRLLAMTCESAACNPAATGITPDDLSLEWRLVFEERAAIREHCGGQAREHAEAEALSETLAAMRADGMRHR